MGWFSGRQNCWGGVCIRTKATQMEGSGGLLGAEEMKNTSKLERALPQRASLSREALSLLAYGGNGGTAHHYVTHPDIDHLLEFVVFVQNWAQFLKQAF